MRSAATLRAPAVLIAATAALLLFPAAPAGAGIPKGERFAEPMGDGPADLCLESNPCSIVNALEDPSVAAGDTITVLPGDYNLTASDTLQPDENPVTIRGQPGAARPRIIIPANALNVGMGTVVRGLYIEATSGSQAVQANGATLEQMEVRATTPNDRGVELSNGAVLRDSFVSTNLGGDTGDAVRVTGGGATLSGVTAIGLGPGSDGVAALATSQTVDLFNVIARGETGAGIRAEDDLDADSLVIKADRINYSSLVEAEPDADIQLTNGQTSPPLFVNADPAVRDFHQLTGSPTIDMGSTFAATGMFDFDGQARVMGCALDVGGDEFSATCPSPPAGTQPATPPVAKKKCKKKKKRLAGAAKKKKCKRKKQR